MAWQFVLTDLDGVPLGEILNAADRQVALPLNKLDTASFKVRLDNPLADALVSTACNLKCYRDRVLRYHGPIISAEETGDSSGASVAVNSVGGGWVLAKRLAGKSATGAVFSALTDRAQIIRSLIDTANTDGETGIEVGSASSASLVTYTAGPYRPISEIITELSTSFDGFDWRVYPKENWIDGVAHSKIGTFVAEPEMGSNQPGAVFEWGGQQTNNVFEWGGGTRYNIASYTRTVSRDTQANKVYHLAQGDTTTASFPPISAIDASSISDYGLLEDLAQADLLDSGLRTTLVQEHVRVRKYPRQVITFTPHIDPDIVGRLPQFGTDYDVGDFVRGRAVYGESVRFDAMFRLWGVTFNIDNLGTERADLTLVDEGA